MASDPDRSHTTESASLISFSDSFHAEIAGKVAAQKTVSMRSGEYALPGNTVKYTIAAQSVGVIPIDTDAVVIQDTIPPETALKVVDIGAPGSGPVNFIEGGIPSTLTYEFLGLTSLTADVEFSNNGGVTFTYLPTTSASGADENVTDIRVSPSHFCARSPAGQPSFSIDLEVVIK